MAFLIFIATRLQNIVARSSRTRIRALCVQAATSAMRLTGTKSRRSAASDASASPAKSVTFPAATPSITDQRWSPFAVTGHGRTQFGSCFGEQFRYIVEASQ
ncbi:hypothetical protein SL103_13850 [Streptomyces lydicus]|uniref:Uncharacterized protein n=1 Tax=Streptomyces lydicus TaxID=47763 RepID=A0A1D7VKB3_9ACTN|nr:hypothetical protein SL103_13850 [Streptomyces lydicus]